jgi:hypothetical protein
MRIKVDMIKETEKRKGGNFGIAFINVHTMEAARALIVKLRDIKKNMKENNE